MADFTVELENIHGEINKTNAIMSDKDGIIEITSLREFKLPNEYNSVIAYVGDVNSQIITFQLPESHEGHKLSECNYKKLKWKNLGNNIEDVSELKIDAEDGKIARWVVPPEAFTSAGAIEISISIYDIKNGKIAFSWNTPTFKGLTVGEAFSQVGEVTATEHFPSKDEILFINDETRAIVAPKGYNNVVCNFGDKNTSKIYFQVKRYINGIDVLDEEHTSISATIHFNSIDKSFTYPAVGDQLIIRKENYAEGSVGDGLITLIWNLPAWLTNNDDSYMGSFSIALSFTSEVSNEEQNQIEQEEFEEELQEVEDIELKWTTSPYKNLIIGNVLPDEIAQASERPDIRADWNAQNGPSSISNKPLIKTGENKYATEIGVRTQAGCNAFKIENIEPYGYDSVYTAPTEMLLTLESTEPNGPIKFLQNGDVCSIIVNSNYMNFGTIIAINEQTITVDNYPETLTAAILDRTTLRDPENTEKTKPYLFIADKQVVLIDEEEYPVGTVSIDSGQVAEGIDSKALLRASHAEGDSTTAAGRYSHAEGSNTYAGYSAHAEGQNSKAIGNVSHAEGYETTASGLDSHTEGQYSTASGNHSHAEGYQTTAEGNRAHAEGYKTSATGTDSHSEGNGSEATGDQSHAEGQGTVASAWAAHAEGYNTTASKYKAHAEGDNTEASGESSHAEGRNTIASGYASHAEGLGTNLPSGLVTQATALAAHAEGKDTTASGEASHAEGYNTRATSNSAHSEGSNTYANGYASHAEGVGSTTANGDYSHAEGWTCTAESAAAHAEGKSSQARGEASHSEGGSTKTHSKYAHTEGYGTHAGYHEISFVENSKEDPERDSAAHAEGKYSRAYGDASHAEGNTTYAIGAHSHAEGLNSKTIGPRSHAEGWGTIAATDSQHVQGKFNLEDTNKKYSHIIGAGTSDAERKNIHTVDWNGNAWFAGDVRVGGTKYDDGKKLATEEFVRKLSLQQGEDGKLYLALDGTTFGDGIVISGVIGSVVGYVDGENNIILTGNLDDGEYNIQYKQSNGDYTEIGGLTIDNTETPEVEPLNLLTIAVDGDGDQSELSHGFYTDAKRIRYSYGNLAEHDQSRTTGFIQVKQNDVICFKNIPNTYTSANDIPVIAFYKSYGAEPANIDTKHDQLCGAQAIRTNKLDSNTQTDGIIDGITEKHYEVTVDKNIIRFLEGEEITPKPDFEEANLKSIRYFRYACPRLYCATEEETGNMDVDKPAIYIKRNGKYITSASELQLEAE